MLELEKVGKKPNAKLTIKAFKNYLRGGKDSFGRVQAPSERVSLANLAALIADRHAGIEPGLISYVARLLNEEIIRQLRDGKSVEALGLGTLYVAAKGAIKGESPQAGDVQKIVLKFKSSRGAQAELADIKPSLVVAMEALPVFNTVEDLKNHKVNSTLKKGTVVCIKGKRLRLDGDKPSVGLYFVGSTGVETKIAGTDILRNTPSMIEFLLPQTFTAGTYTLKVANQSKLKAGFSKRVAVGFSEFSVEVV